MNKQQLIKNFLEPETKLLFSKALEQAFICENKHMTTFTEFLDPIKTEKFKDIISKNLSIGVDSYGGSDGCERQIISFYQEYTKVSVDDYPIDAVEIEFSGKSLSQITHRDFLGSVLGLGLDRKKVGDIIIFSERAIVFVHKDISLFLTSNLTKVKHVNVNARVISSDLIFAALSEYEEMIVNLSSMRLDSLLSSAFKISRSKAAKMVVADKAFINWVSYKSPDKLVKEGDIITLRGHGRIKVLEILGQSKKDKIILKIHKTRKSN